MPLSPYPIESFGGLLLVEDPEEVGFFGGAVDLLNIDFDRQGRLRSRDGYQRFTRQLTTAPYGYSQLAGYRVGYVAAPPPVDGVMAFRPPDPGEYASFATTGPSATESSLYAGQSAASTTLDMLDTGGSFISSYAPTGIARWNSGGWATPPSLAGRYPKAMGVQFPDNRLVIGGGSYNGVNYRHRVWFSDPYAPESFAANNYVDLSVGDGDFITAIATWQNYLFVFKAGKTFVFYGNSTDPQGKPLFNYRIVDQQVGALAAVAGREGVYFLNRNGIYLTTGGPPVRISDGIRPLFVGVDATVMPAGYQGGPIVWGELAARSSTGWQPGMAYANDRLYVSVRMGNSLPGAISGNNRVIVYDTVTRTWTLWDMPMAGVAAVPAGTQGRTDVYFSYAAGSKSIGYLSDVVATDDAGVSNAAITSRYQSGFSNLGYYRGATRSVQRYAYPGSEITIRETMLTGVGTVELGWARDFGSVDAATVDTVTLGTGRVARRGLHRRALAGGTISFRLASVSGGAWSVNQVVPMIREIRGAGEITG